MTRRRHTPEQVVRKFAGSRQAAWRGHRVSAMSAGTHRPDGYKSSCSTVASGRPGSSPRPRSTTTSSSGTTPVVDIPGSGCTHHPRSRRVGSNLRMNVYSLGPRQTRQQIERC